MDLKSFAITTDLFFARAAGEVIDRGNYLVVRTPSNPGFHWGNYLIFPEPPQSGDEERWPAIFKTELKDISGIRHIALTWDQEEAGDCIALFKDKGFAFEAHKVLAAEAVQKPAKCNTDVVIRVIESDAQWEYTIQIQLTMNEQYEPQTFETSKRAQMA